MTNLTSTELDFTTMKFPKKWNSNFENKNLLNQQNQREKMNILHSKIYTDKEKTGTLLLVFPGLFGMFDNWGSFRKEFGELFPTHLN